MKKIAIASTIIVLCSVLVFGFYLGPTSNKSEIVKLEVSKGDTYSTLGAKLKKNNLIKSTLVYRIYIKFTSPGNLEACEHTLDKSMGVSKIVSALSKTCTANKDVVRVTIPEGKHIEQIAEIYASKTNNSKEILLKEWNNKEFVDEVIENYPFLTNDVKNSKVRYALEGYLFPSTYEFLNADVTPKEIAIKMLNQLNKIYEKYKNDIEGSNYTFHQILTMASIVEYEAILDDERPIIAGVFYNRLENPGYETAGLLQSCATLGYALGNWKLTYTNRDMRTDHVYNTYMYKGLPPGPGGMPGEKSIVAAINPSKTDYYYFLANVCDANNKKSIFAKTNAEHVANADKYLCQ